MTGVYDHSALSDRKISWGVFILSAVFIDGGHHYMFEACDFLIEITTAHPSEGGNYLSVVE
jgi:hypothetical protein